MSETTPTKTAVLDATLGSIGAVRDRLVAELGLPDQTGRNLDALWDALTTEGRGPFRIVWRDHAAARTKLGADFDRLVALFHDVVAARSDVSFTIER